MSTSSCQDPRPEDELMVALGARGQFNQVALTSGPMPHRAGRERGGRIAARLPGKGRGTGETLVSAAQVWRNLSGGGLGLLARSGDADELTSRLSAEHKRVE